MPFLNPDSFSPVLLAAGGGFRFAIEQAHAPGLVICVILFIFSLFSWSVMVAKAMALKKADTRDAEFRKEFHNSRDPMELFAEHGRIPGSPLYAVYRNGSAELGMLMTGSDEVDETFLARLHRAGRIPFAQTRSVQQAIENAKSEAVSHLESRMSWLATAVSGAPFLGLLGTVWGVMETFSGIAGGGGSASLQSMAPGVASALVTTVLALLVAIPAMFGYNYLAAAIRKKIRAMDQFASVFMNEIERYYVAFDSPVTPFDFDPKPEFDQEEEFESEEEFDTELEFETGDEAVGGTAPIKPPVAPPAPVLNREEAPKPIEKETQSPNPPALRLEPILELEEEETPIEAPELAKAPKPEITFFEEEEPEEEPAVAKSNEASLEESKPAPILEEEAKAPEEKPPALPVSYPSPPDLEELEPWEPKSTLQGKTGTKTAPIVREPLPLRYERDDEDEFEINPIARHAAAHREAAMETAPLL